MPDRDPARSRPVTSLEWKGVYFPDLHYVGCNAADFCWNNCISLYFVERRLRRHVYGDAQIRRQPAVDELLADAHTFDVLEAIRLRAAGGRERLFHHIQDV